MRAAVGLLCWGSVLFSALLSSSSWAQVNFPTKPIRWISPFAAGGGADITSRVIAQKLSVALGHQVVVDNRGGAGGNIGVELGVKSPADGYTVVLGTIGPMAINVSLYRKLPFDPVKDLTPVTMAADALNALVIHPSLPVKTVKQLVTLLKARPDALSFGSSGPGATDHLAGELFKSMTQTKMVHIPYKGGAPAMLDLMSGQVQLVFATMSTAVGSIRSQKIRALGMTGLQRFALMPDLPTVAEAGVPGFEVRNWYAVYLPAGTPPKIITLLNAEIVKILAMKEVKDKLLESGILASPSTPAELASYQLSEIKRWGEVVRDSGAKVD
jgi:tripartite-type tricarboxylate transporter receptor subunit TctC